MTPGQEVLARRFRRQAAWCAGEGEELYAELLERSAADIEAGGPCWSVLQPYATEPVENAVALRFLAGVHRLVLTGEVPALAAYYPSAGGPGPASEAWPAFEAVVQERTDQLRRLTALSCQTNDVGRSAALLPGFLAVARATGRRLRLLEVGASAGLNLRFDRYWYGAWGDPDSPVRLDGAYAGEPPSRPRRVRVAERLGCDVAPIDPASVEGGLALRSFTWPANRARMARLQGALEVARGLPVEVDCADAVDWLDARLGRGRTRAAAVVFHSVFLQYLPPPRRTALEGLIARAGRGAVADAPLAWLRMEPGKSAFEVRCTLWPGGREVLLGTCGPHGFDYRPA